MEEILELFRSEVQERLSRVEDEIINNAGRDIELIYREFHTIKGTAQMLGFEKYSEAAHMVEDVVKPLWKQNASLPDEFIPRLLRVLDVFRRRLGEDMTDDDLKEIDSILKGEREEEEEKEATIEIVTKIDEEKLERILDSAEETLFKVYRDYQNDKVLLRNMKNLVEMLREMYWEIETVSLQDVLRGFDRLVYEEASREGKKVRFAMKVEGVRVKKNIASPIRDSLVHIVKNSVVHGIERPEERKELGKSEEGTVSINARTVGRKIFIEVEDDGKGIDKDKIRKKLQEMGREVPEDDEKLINVIFEPFFSTKERADLGGGRGVGLSSVRAFLESIGGKIKVETWEGRGTKFTLEIPSERVWERVLVVRSGIQMYALRLSDIVRIDEGGEGEFTGQMRAVLKSGNYYRFDTKVSEGELLVIENPFPNLENVLFWVNFLGLPVPVFG